MSRVIAIVGRPNVGKSALFNRIVGKRVAIVHDRPGVTRDRISAPAEWRGQSFSVIDTGGIGAIRGEKTSDLWTAVTLEQVEAAVESADEIIFVVSAQEGITSLDREVAQRLRKQSKSITLAVNKVDLPQHETDATEFSELGFDALITTSAIHGRGVDALLKHVVPRLPSARKEDSSLTSEDAEIQEEPFKLAIVGRPNVGKSSIINALTKSERVIVSDIPGTTRDAVDVPFEIDTEGFLESYVLIDTAGIRKRNRVDDSVEFFSTLRSSEAIKRCDLAVLVLDAETGVTEQDKKIAGQIEDAGCGCVIVINKWDLVADDLTEARRELNRKNRRSETHRPASDEPLTMLSEFADWVQRQLFFLSHAPVIFSSAHTGFHLERLLEAVRVVKDQLDQRAPTGVLNRVVHDIVDRRPMSLKTGHPVKFYYATQVDRRPPTFLLFVNRKGALAENYQKYLIGELRRAFGFEGCPIRIVLKPRVQKDAAPEFRRPRAKLRSQKSGKRHSR